jgi:adenylosuccinate lyase
MARNLEASHGLVFSHRLLLALVEAGLDRAQAYDLVQRNALRAWDEERDFRSLVDADPEIRARLDASAIDAVFDARATVAHLERVFDRLRTLVRKEEPVHA